MNYVTSKRHKHKNFEKKLFLDAVMKVADENSRIRSRINWSEVRIRGFESVPKCHRSATMVKTQQEKLLELFYLFSIPLLT